MKKILIIPQLDQHHYSTLKLKHEFIKLNMDVDVLNFDGYYNSKPIGNIQLKYSTFFGLKYGNTKLILRQFVDRVIFFLNMLYLRKLAREYDHIIAFTETLIIRGILFFGNKMGAKTHLIMEGMRSEHIISFRSLGIKEFNIVFRQLILRFKYRFLSLHQGTFISVLLPGINGSTYVTSISPIGEYSRQVIQNLAHRKTNLLRSGIPKYVGIEKISSYDVESDEFVIIYFTSAFKWHDKLRFHEYQNRDLTAIIDLVKSLPKSYKLYIKSHPRDQLEQCIINLIDEIKVFLCEEDDLLTILKKSNLNIGNISTVLAEGEIYGCEMISVLLSFPVNELSNSFVWKLRIEPITNIEDLKTHIMQDNRILNSNEIVSSLIYVSSSIEIIINDILDAY